jgi:hypothetical protein
VITTKVRINYPPEQDPNIFGGWKLGVRQIPNWQLDIRGDINIVDMGEGYTFRINGVPYGGSDGGQSFVGPPGSIQFIDANGNPASANGLWWDDATQTLVVNAISVANDVTVGRNLYVNGPETILRNLQVDKLGVGMPPGDNAVDIAGDLNITGKFLVNGQEYQPDFSGIDTGVFMVFGREGPNIVAQRGDYFADIIDLRPHINPWQTVQDGITGLDGAVNSLLRGMIYIGYWDAASNIATFVQIEHLDPQPLPLASTFPAGDYLIITSSADFVLNPGENPTTVHPGDHIISDGEFWNYLAVGSWEAEVLASQIPLDPEIDSWTTVQNAFESIKNQLNGIYGGMIRAENITIIPQLSNDLGGATNVRDGLNFLLTNNIAWSRITGAPAFLTAAVTTIATPPSGSISGAITFANGQNMNITRNGNTITFNSTATGSGSKWSDMAGGGIFYPGRVGINSSASPRVNVRLIVGGTTEVFNPTISGGRILETYVDAQGNAEIDSWNYDAGTGQVLMINADPLMLNNWIGGKPVLINCNPNFDYPNQAILQANGAVSIAGLGGGSFGQLRLWDSGYGLIHRVAGAQYYILISTASNGWGGWTDARPFMMDLTNGNIAMSQNLNVSGDVNGNRVIANWMQSYGDLNVNGNLSVLGGSNLQNGVTTNNIIASGNVQSGSLTTWSTTVHGDVQIDGNLTVNGRITGYNGVNTTQYLLNGGVVQFQQGGWAALPFWVTYVDGWTDFPTEYKNGWYQRIPINANMHQIVVHLDFRALPGYGSSSYIRFPWVKTPGSSSYFAVAAQGAAYASVPQMIDDSPHVQIGGGPGVITQVIGSYYIRATD